MVRSMWGLVLWISLVAAAGCGGGGDGGSPTGAAVKTKVIPHVLETKGGADLVTPGDVDGDGILDLLVFDAATASVSVLRSTGVREAPAPSIPGGPRRLERGAEAYGPGALAFLWDSTRDLTVADVDGDGVPDLVAAAGPRQEVGVWAGEGASSHGLRYHRWRETGTVRVDVSADRVATGDVNGDGRCDLVTLEEATGRVRVLLQDPAAPFSFLVDASPPDVGPCRGLVVADLDRDGRLDLLTNCPDRDVFVSLGSSAAAGWTIRESPTRRSTGRSFAVGDVDGDGWLDVVVVVEGGEAVVCLRQRPGEPGTFDDTLSPLGITVNEEGVRCAQVSGNEPSCPRAGTATGEEGVPSTDLAVGRLGVPQQARCVCQAGFALADVDRDGALDLVGSPPDGDPDPSMVVAFGIRESPTRFSGSERLVSSLRESPTRASTGRLAAVCDLDCDGRVDVLSGDPDFDLLALDYLEDAVSPPARPHRERLRVTPTSQTTGCRVADLDRDGYPDLVCPSSAGLEVHWQDASAPGTFLTPSVLAPGQSLRGVAVGDVNGDGCPDLVVCTSGACAAILRDTKAPRSFLPAVQFPPTAGAPFLAVALGDLDGDGILDCVAIRESPTRASVCRGLGQGFFDVFTEIDVAVGDPRAVAVGDVNGDGRLDVVACATQHFAVAYQDPAGKLSFAPPVVVERQGGVRVAVGDLDGDGRCDVVTAGDRGVHVALQSPLDPGDFLPAYALSSEACGGLSVGDDDCDGVLDVRFVETSRGTLVSTSGDPDFDLLRTISLNGLPPGVPYEQVHVAAGDLDGDGRADLVVACPSAPGAASSVLVVVGQDP